MTSVRTRILLFFTLFALASLGAVYMSSRSTYIVGKAADSVVTRHLPMVYALGELQLSLERQNASVFHYLFSREKIWLDDVEKERLNFMRWFVESESLASEQVELDKLQEIDELYVQYENMSRQLVMTWTKDQGAALKMVLPAQDYLDRIEKLIDEIKGIRQGMTIVRQEQIGDTLKRHQNGAVFFLLTIVFFFLALAFYLWRFLVQPLDLLLNGIRNFTRGKTDIQIPRVGKDELGELQEAFNEMSRELNVERKRLRSESQSDSLTGLFNMRYFRLQLVDEFSRSQRYNRPITLLMIDVDHFKAYNDRNGHPAGDIVLKEVSRILVRNVRGTDIVARYGGEEFVVLLPETPLDAGASVAEKIRKATEEHYFPFAGNQGSDRVTLSVGVASYPDVQVTSDQDLIEASDKALYAAKKSGRNCIRLFTKSDAAASDPVVASPTTVR